MVGKHRRDSYRPIEVGRRVVVYRLLGALNFALHLTNTVEILIQAHAIGSADALLELGDVSGEGIQQAGASMQCRLSCGCRASLSKQPLEDDARMRLGRQRSRG